MIIRYPKHYEQFQCIAERCEDTCCAGWEIDIDDASYQYYMNVGGEFGERLRQSIREYEKDDEDVYEQHGFILTEQRRCPFLDKNNLCDLYRELGEEALCDVCTDTPRNFFEYGGAREVSLSASCAEAGRLLYGREEPISFVEKVLEEELDFEETEEELALAKQVCFARNQAIAILQNRNIPLIYRIVHFLHYAEQVQKSLNEEMEKELSDIDTVPYFDNSTSVVNGVEESFVYHCFLARLRTFTEMESISEEWENLLCLLHKRYVEPEEGASHYLRERREFWQEMEHQGRIFEYEHLLVYYSFLCLARCVDDFDFLAKAKMVVTSFLMIFDMDCVWYAEHGGVYSKEARIMMARIYAKEVEHSDKNLEYLAEEFLFEDTYKVENLCVSLTIV